MAKHTDFKSKRTLMTLSVAAMLLLALICAIASLLDHLKGSMFAKEHIYYSAPFGALLVILAILIIAATWAFKLYKRPSLLLIHLSFIAMLIGAALSHYAGFSAVLELKPNTPAHIAYGERTELKMCKDNVCASSQDARDGLSLNGAFLSYVDYSNEASYKLLDSDDLNDGAGIMVNAQELSMYLQNGECLELKNGACCFNKSLQNAQNFSFIDDKLVYSGPNLGCEVSFSAPHAKWDYSLFGGKLHVLFMKLCKDNICKDAKLELNKQIKLNDYHLIWSQEAHELGFSVHLIRFYKQYYSGTKKEKDFISEFVIIKNNEQIRAKVSLNKPFDYAGFRFFAHEFSEHSSKLLINYDPGKWPTYIGYVMLFIGCFLNLFSLIKKYKSLLAAVLCFMAFNQTAKANAFYDELATTLTKDYTQDLCSFYSLANKICSRLNCKDGKLATIIKLSQDVDYVAHAKIFKLSNELANWLNLSTNLSLSELYEGSKYKLAKRLEQIKQSAELSKLEKELIKLDEAVNVVFLIMHEDIFNILAQPGPNGLEFKGLNDDDLSLENIKLAKNYQTALLLASKNNDYSKALSALLDIKASVAKYELKSPLALKLDYLLAKYSPFTLLCIASCLLSLLSLFALFMPKFKTILSFLCIAFALILAACIIARCLAAGFIALSGTYESLLYIALIASIAAVFFKQIARLCALMAASCFLLTAAISPAQISALAPVLNSKYLAYHVSLITASYAFFAISALLGAVAAYKLDNKALLIRANLCAHIGLLLLSAGTFLGAIWANESWGRYWAWDNKETWSLITILVYAALLHSRLKGFLLGCAHLVSFVAVLFTYFGVNFYLKGLHSYANNEPIKWEYLLIAAAVLIGYLAVVFIRRKREISSRFINDF